MTPPQILIYYTLPCSKVYQKDGKKATVYTNMQSYKDRPDLFLVRAASVINQRRHHQAFMASPCRCPFDGSLPLSWKWYDIVSVFSLAIVRLSV